MEDKNTIDYIAYMNGEEVEEVEGESFNHLKAYLLEMIGRPVGMEDISNVCQIYQNATMQGAKFDEIAELCKDVLKIASMPLNSGVDPWIHHRLVTMEDTYHDFVQGIETNLLENPKVATGFKHFLEMYPNATPNDCIVVSSMFNSKPNFDETDIRRTLRVYNSEKRIAFEKLPKSDMETIIIPNNHGWRLSTVMIGNMGYTVRVSGPMIVLDYEGICIGGCILQSTDDEHIYVMFINFVDQDRFPGLLETAEIYLEEKVAMAKIKYLGFVDRHNRKEVFEKRGYEFAGHPSYKNKIIENIQLYQKQVYFNLKSGESKNGKSL